MVSYKTFCEFLTEIRKVCGVYLMWIFLHYIAAHMYIYLCVPSTWAGFAVAPLMVPTPQCQSLRWVVYTGGNNIAAMWILLGAWLINYLCRA
jgi:hypothetical protein